jgi:hypothetical protein
MEPSMKRIHLLSCLLVPLAACTTAPPASVAVPDALRPAPGEVRVGAVAARGVQIYECRAKKDDPRSAEWAFVAPEAELFDAQGRRVGTHYAGPQWESLDGSKVAGTAKARSDAPQAGAIPWLLLTAHSVGPAGAWSGVTSVQRIHTVGGVAPAAAECSTASLGKQARVAYSADYVMYGSP